MSAEVKKPRRVLFTRCSLRDWTVVLLHWRSWREVWECQVVVGWFLLQLWLCASGGVLPIACQALCIMANVAQTRTLNPTLMQDSRGALTAASQTTPDSWKVQVKAIYGGTKRPSPKGLSA